MLYEDDTLLASVRFSIAFIATIPASVVTGLYCTITKKVRWVTVISFLIFVAFFACMAMTDEDTNENTWGYPVMLGSALGMTLITLVTVAQLSTPPELISIASGLIISIRSLGGSIGIAICKAHSIPCCRVIKLTIANSQRCPGRRNAAPRRQHRQRGHFCRSPPRLSWTFYRGFTQSQRDCCCTGPRGYT